MHSLSLLKQTKFMEKDLSIYKTKRKRPDLVGAFSIFGIQFILI